MTLRLKLTISMLCAGLFTGSVVGLTAWWLVMQDFRQSIEENAFTNFEQDITAYISLYGTYERGQREEPFPLFVRRIHQPKFLSDRPPPPDFNHLNSGIHRQRAPFQFLLLTPQGQVINPTADYHKGQIVPDTILSQGKPIVINGQSLMLAVPIGTPILSPQDKIYLNSLKRALGLGMIAATLVALLLGVIFGGRMVTRLQALMNGLKNMQPDGQILEPIEIRSRDEIGQLAQTFNKMSKLLMEAHQELRELSLRDPLTGLYNRRYFDEQARNMFQRALRYQAPLCVMLADLDHFKLINDSFSHSVGDAVLQQVAEIFQTNIRTSDLIARYGGEEFIAVFAESNLLQARQRCEQLRQHIETNGWDKIAPGLKVTVSIGLCDSIQLGSLEDMIDMADEQLYVAKDKGRNRIEPERQIA